MIKCSQCSTWNESNRIYCSKCGTYLLSDDYSRDYKEMFISGLLGLIVWALFYNGVLETEILFSRNAFVYRVFTIHWICMVITLVFINAFIYLLLKYFSFRKEKAVLSIFYEKHIRDVFQENLNEHNAENMMKKIVGIMKSNQIKNFNSTVIFKRFVKLVNFGLKTKGNQNITEYFSYESELDYNKIHSSFTVIKVFAWALPILGFIGTVLGISQAIEHFTVSLGSSAETQMLESVMMSLNNITSGLSTAFDTTLLALMFVVPLMLFLTFIEKIYDDFLNSVERFFLNNLMPYFKIGTKDSLPDEVIKYIESFKKITENWQSNFTPVIEQFQNVSYDLSAQLKGFSGILDDINSRLLEISDYTQNEKVELSKHDVLEERNINNSVKKDIDDNT